jgi:hypothetical protein
MSHDHDERPMKDGSVSAGLAAGAALGAALSLLLVSNIIDQQRAVVRLQKLDKDQATIIANAHKAEDQLNMLAKGLQSLANGGDANAAAVTAILQRNGIKIKGAP